MFARIIFGPCPLNHIDSLSYIQFYIIVLFFLCRFLSSPHSIFQHSFFLCLFLYSFLFTHPTYKLSIAYHQHLSSQPTPPSLIMDSLQVPEPPSVVSASKSTPLKKAATADYVSTPNLLHQSRSLDPGTMSIYAAAAYDANNIRRQRSESFVQHHHQRKSRQRWLQEHSDQDFIVRAPSQMCLTRHHLVSPPMPSLNTHHHALDTDIYQQHHHNSNGSNNSNSDRRSSVTSETSSSNSSQDISGTSTATATSATVIKSMEATKHEYFPSAATDNTGALLGGVLIRRAVRPSLMETMTTSNTDTNTTTTTTTSYKEQSKKSDSSSSSSSSSPKNNTTTTTIDTALTSMTTQERWTPPPIMSPESLYDDGKIPFSSTPTSPSTSNRNLFKLKKSNSHSSSSSPSLFHFKRFGSKHELDPSDNAKLVSPPPPVSFEENPET